MARPQGNCLEFCHTNQSDCLLTKENIPTFFSEIFGDFDSFDFGNRRSMFTMMTGFLTPMNPPATMPPANAPGLIPLAKAAQSCC